MVSYLKKHFSNWTINKRLNDEVQLLFLQRLYHLLKLGYSILEALEVMKWDKDFKPICGKMIHYLKKGNRIDKVFEKCHFHETVVAYLYFVTINGNLILSLEKCMEMFEHRMTYLKKFKRIIRYPIVLMIFFSTILLFLKQSVLPSFIELFQTNQDSTQTVMFTLMFIDFFTTIVFILVGMLITSILLWNMVKNKITIERKIKLYRKIPVYRMFLTMQTSYYFSTHFSMFLKAGMSIKAILHAITKQNKLPIISHYAQLMINQLSQGQKVDHLLLGLPFIEKQIGHIFQKNEDVQSIERDLTAYADYITNKMERKMMQIIHLIQPIFFILLALFIIFIYVTLMWPMFQVINTV